MRTNRRSFINVLIALLPTLCMFYLLIELFPYTGLGRVIMLPFIFMINAVLIGLTVFLIRKFYSVFYIIILLVVVLLTLRITVSLYPQEFSPSIPQQINDSIAAINDYDHSLPADLEKPSFNTYQTGANEKYVVALYKYRHDIPLDGSFHLYNNDSDEDAIRRLEDIPAKLAPHHKLMWRYLENSQK
ncbi:hypothetical protein [Paenibacillus sp. NPDC055715]